MITSLLFPFYTVPDVNWIQVEFAEPTTVTGIITQGRSNDFVYDVTQWVTRFMVHYGDAVDSLQTFTAPEGTLVVSN